MLKSNGSSAAAQVRDQIVIRNCDGIFELQACTDLEQQIWDFDERDVVPVRMYVVAQNIGGHVIGAFHDHDLVGFAMSLPGARNGHAYLYSRVLAVREEYRNAGLGRKLKLFQRTDALSRGFDLIEWTFDPLEIKNAYLNIERLGTIVRRYHVNQYGSYSSKLQGGLPSDRLVAEWWLRSRRVDSLLQSGVMPASATECTIPVPADISKWKASIESRPRALEVQSQNRQCFLEAFSRGLVVLGYDVSVNGNGNFLLGRWDESK